MVAVPETAGVHWKTCSGAVPELPQLPASALVPLVAPLKVPPWAGMTAGLVQSPASAPENSPAWPWQADTLTLAASEHAPPACPRVAPSADARGDLVDRKSTRLNSSHPSISYAVFCLKKKKN